MQELVADKDRHQWFTPTWAAELLIDSHFPELSEDDVVAEPTCGTGTFLKAVPARCRAYGVEIDPVLAAEARASSGRQVITGDFLTCGLPEQPTAIVGNPPFDLKVVDAILARCREVLPEGGKAGFILPAYAFQTASRVAAYRKDWSISQEMIPRNLFRNMEKPLCFAVFRKDRLGELRGFALYSELHDVNSMRASAARALSTRPRPWEAAAAQAVTEAGGCLDEEGILARLAPKRPSGDPWWKARLSAALRSSGILCNEGGSWRLSARAKDSDRESDDEGFRGT